MLTEWQKRRIKLLRNDALSLEEIAGRMNLPKTTIYYVLHRRTFQAYNRKRVVKCQTELIRTLRATVRRLEARLGLRAGAE